VTILPEYNFNSSSPNRYADEFNDILTAIDSLRGTLARTDFPHGRDFQETPGNFAEARIEYRGHLEALQRLEDYFTILLVHAVESPRYR